MGADARMLLIEIGVVHVVVLGVSSLWGRLVLLVRGWSVVFRPGWSGGPGALFGGIRALRSPGRLRELFGRQLGHEMVALVLRVLGLWCRLGLLVRGRSAVLVFRGRWLLVSFLRVDARARLCVGLLMTVGAGAVVFLLGVGVAGVVSGSLGMS